LSNVKPHCGISQICLPVVNLLPNFDQDSYLPALLVVPIHFWVGEFVLSCSMVLTITGWTRKVPRPWVPADHRRGKLPVDLHTTRYLLVHYRNEKKMEYVLSRRWIPEYLIAGPSPANRDAIGISVPYGSVQL